MEADKCDKCDSPKPLHSVGDKRICCRCYVVDGNPPADWHPVCMDEYRKKFPLDSRDSLR